MKGFMATVFAARQQSSVRSEIEGQCPAGLFIAGTRGDPRCAEKMAPRDCRMMSAPQKRVTA